MADEQQSLPATERQVNSINGLGRRIDTDFEAVSSRTLDREAASLMIKDLRHKENDFRPPSLNEVGSVWSSILAVRKAADGIAPGFNETDGIATDLHFSSYVREQSLTANQLFNHQEQMLNQCIQQGITGGDVTDNQRDRIEVMLEEYPFVAKDLGVVDEEGVWARPTAKEDLSKVEAMRLMGAMERAGANPSKISSIMRARRKERDTQAKAKSLARAKESRREDEDLPF